MAHRFSHGWMADTSPEALRVFLDLNHRLSPQTKYNQVVEMFESVNQAWEAEERRLHPAADDREIFLRVAYRRLGPELTQRAYGWAPDE